MTSLVKMAATRPPPKPPLKPENVLTHQSQNSFMPDPAPAIETCAASSRENWALLILLIVVSLALGSILLPFYATICGG